MDESLPVAADRAGEVASHLAECWTCRVRKGEIDESIRDFQSLYEWSIRSPEAFWAEVWRFFGVVASAGGSPHDINLIQAHKALEMASHACEEGGTIVLVAECADGLGRVDFLKWFDAKDSRELESRLRSAYEVNGQTAWSLLTKAERFNVRLVSSLPDEDVRLMRMTPARTLDEALAHVEGEGYVMRRGAAFMPVAP